MNEKQSALQFRSPLAPLIEKFLEGKRACGYRYARGSLFLLSFDRFLVREGLSAMELPRSIVERWAAKKAHEKPTNQAARVSYLREFARFLVRHDHKAFIPVSGQAPLFRTNFVPHIFKVEELRRLFVAADRLPPARNSRYRHIILPEIFRVLYACGLRVSEALKLTVGDVDLSGGILRIRQGKFRRDRLVPVAPALLLRLSNYAAKMGKRNTQAIFFPAPTGRSYRVSAVYGAFRCLLHAANIAHGGRGCGPRLHDLRHTFAVHRLVRWYREGADLKAKLPILAVYMGHASLNGTQRYLHLIADLFPEVSSRVEAVFGQVIPTGGDA